VATARAASARRTPRQARSKEKVDRILAAARALLIAEGPEGFNTNRVARDAGIGIGSLYEYFPNKQAIFDRLIDELSIGETDAILARLGEIGEAPPAQLIDTIVELVFALYVENHALYRVLWAMSTSPRVVGRRPGERLIMSEVRDRLEPHREALGIEDLDLTCFTVFHMVESLSDQMASLDDDRWSQQRRAKEIARAVRRYVGVDAG
jgi:AcrR family transcriptional regulator